MSWPFFLLPLGVFLAGAVLKARAIRHARPFGLSLRACEAARGILDHAGRPETAVESGWGRGGAQVLQLRPALYESREAWDVGEAALLAGMLVEEAAHPLVRVLRDLAESLAPSFFTAALACFLAALVLSDARGALAAGGAVFANLWMDLAVVLAVLRWRGAGRAKRGLQAAMPAAEALRAAQAAGAQIFDPLGGSILRWLDLGWRSAKKRA